MRRFRRARRQQGSVTVVTAGVMAVALVIALASADVARVLIAKGSAQTAADAAALAAAQDLVLPSETDPAQQAAAFAQANGASLVACECATGSTEAVVTVRVPVVLAFLGGTRDVVASARAVTDSPFSP
jgi:secretion/DNA translocation related TadE-like protein